MLYVVSSAVRLYSMGLLSLLLECPRSFSLFPQRVLSLWITGRNRTKLRSLEAAESGIDVDVSVIAVVNKTICGVFYRSLFSLPTRPYCFHFFSSSIRRWKDHHCYIHLWLFRTASFSSLRFSSAHSLFAIGHQRRCMARLALPVVVVRLG